MTNKEFMKLCEPVNMLIGYALSASDLNKDSNLELWAERLKHHAEKLKQAWDEVI